MVTSLRDYMDQNVPPQAAEKPKPAPRTTEHINGDGPFGILDKLATWTDIVEPVGVVSVPQPTVRPQGKLGFWCDLRSLTALASRQPRR